MDPEILEKALEKLWIHGGAQVSPEQDLRRGRPDWRAPYLAQRERKVEQLAQMARFAESHGCRMLHLVQHFGDKEDPGTACGHCDACQLRLRGFEQAGTHDPAPYTIEKP